ncbi:hypothetical protein [Streptomyces sp. OR43]|uniref:hypothetical protein n=1 Tax=Streptomyces sp. or43 TaxID=2478957 RepID=UPI0011CDA267|nr:hypothetical protein [Streptomyces sp. or43]TXS34749.1 hypothetical protein EAO72_40845 [Streptomyces sp. or43]
MTDVYVPLHGDRYHIYDNCSAIESGQQGNTAQAVPIYQPLAKPIEKAEAEGKTLCRTCLAAAQRS